jgi:glycosyltransferase involved in cell wall biosynthesis
LHKPALRIVHVLDSLAIGGQETMVLALSTLQVQAGHPVRIVCLWLEGALAEAARAAGVDVVCADKKPGLDAGALRRRRRLITAFKPDVLHTHDVMSHYYGVAACLGRRPGTIVNTRHGYATRNPQGRDERFYRQAMLRSDYGVGVSRSLQAYFTETGLIEAHKARAIPNGIEVTRFHARSDEAAHALRSELGLPVDAVTFATVGRLNEVKRQVDLLHALKARLDAGDHACLLVVGDGPMRETLEATRDQLGLGAHMRMLGARKDVPQLLAAMDVFVLCSRSEGYSMALVEASTAALPIIATDVGGNAEIVQHEATGLIVPPADAAALSAAMGRLCADAAQRQRMGEQGRAWALREGSVQAMAAAYEALYRRQG